MENKEIMITGGAGFIGSHLAQRLCEKNKIIILDNFRRNSISNTSLSLRHNVKIVRGDVCDWKSVAPLMRGVTHVIHLAAIAGVDAVMGNPVKTMHVALLGTFNMLRMSDQVERFIDFSTSEVFGNYAYKVSEGNDTPIGAVGEARWTYAVSKLATEHLCYNFYKEFGLPTCAIRPFNIFGPNQQGGGAIHQFILNAISGEPLTIYNEGNQIRSWCYIDDIVDATLECLENHKAIGETFNIGNPRNTLTIHQLAKEIVKVSGSKSEIVFMKKDMQDVELRIPSIEKAERLLGYLPKVDLEEGLLKTIEWYRHAI